MNFFIRIILVALFSFHIKADITEALREKMLSAFNQLLLFFLPYSDCLRTGTTIEVEIVMIISEKSLPLELFFLQTFITPAFASSFLTPISSPRTFFLIPLGALQILTFIFFPFLHLLSCCISLVMFRRIMHLKSDYIGMIVDVIEDYSLIVIR